MIAPPGHGVFVLEEADSDELSPLGAALEAFDSGKAVQLDQDVA